MYAFLQSFHSGFRWIVLVLIVMAVVQSFRKWRSGQAYVADDRKMHLYTMTAVHLQLLVGIVLYFISPKVQFKSGVMSDEILRFFTVEHAFGMILATALITIAYSKVKRLGNTRAVFLLYIIGLIVILASIPWPFQEYGTGWF